MKLLLLIPLLFLSGCTVGFTTPHGTRVTAGFNPTAEQIEGFLK